MKNKENIIGFLKKVLPFLLIIISALLLALLFIWFHNANSKTVHESSYSYIDEITRRDAHTFQTKLEDQMLMLESLAKNFQDVDFTDYNATKEAINKTQGIGDFKRITFATLTGSTMNNNNTTSGNILKKDYFQDAADGNPAVSSTIEIDEDGEEVLTLAVPIKNAEEDVVAVLTGTFNRALLNQLFSSSFGDYGYSYVTDNSGAVLVLPQNVNTYDVIFDSNFFDYLSLAELPSDILLEDIMGDFTLEIANNLKYDIGQETYYAFYTPIELHGWMALSIVKAEFIQQRIDTYNTYSFLLTIGVSVLFGLFLVAFVAMSLYLRKVRNMQDDMTYRENYFKKISSNRHLVLFEFNTTTHLISLNGDISFIIDTEEEKIDISLERFLSLLHPEDETTLHRFLKSLDSPATSFASEFRLRCRDGVYHWYQLQANRIFSSNMKDCKVLGNISNVDTPNKDPLIFESTRNSLTGFYKEEAFETEVNKILRNSSPKSIHALYCIDPDGFSEINEIMGHETGDQILNQVAQRISKVFSYADIFGNYDGDTFMVFLHVLPKSQDKAIKLVEEKAEQLIKELTTVYRNNKGSFELTSSVGIAIYAKHGANYHALSVQAQTALDYMKKNNKGHYGIYSIEMEES